MLFRTLALSLGMLLAAPSLAQTFTNANPITIPRSGPASPYASTINVSGLSNPQAIRVTLNGLTHGNTADLDILLLAPDNTKILLLSDIGSTNPATRATSNSTISFEYRASFTIQAGAVPVPIVSGIYSPTIDSTSDTFPVPAPAGPYTGTLQTPILNNTCNGVWTLFVIDDAAGNSGSISGGWSITFNPAAPAGPPTAFTYQGRLDSAGAPYNGNADFVFALFDAPTGGNPVGVPISSLNPVTAGLLTTTLDFGALALDTSARWLEIQVRAPAGSGSFTTLSPRQAITPAPLALTALSLSSQAGALSPALSVGGSDPSYVGIGTTTPLRSLHVSTGSNFSPILITSPYPGIQLNSPTQAWQTFVIGNDLWFATTSTDGSASTGRIIMKPNGNVGIANANPSTTLQVSGTITGTVKNFAIDHPLDPANKTLVHSCVESDQYKNFYDGTITTSSEGLATITLPDWFPALNETFRYQLTVIDERASDGASVRIVRKLGSDSPNTFTIKSVPANLEVSWQVTGVRKDAYVKAHPLVVEQDKPQKGTYLHPELFQSQDNR